MSRAVWVMLGIGLLAVAEIALLVWVAGQVGVGWTLLVLAALAIVGGLLLRHEGAKAWTNLRQAQQAPDAVGRTISDAGLVLVGGLLLMLPGFLTDILGLLCLIPFTRPLARRGVQAVLHAATRKYRDQADLLRARLERDAMVQGQVADTPSDPADPFDTDRRRPRPDDPTVIRGEVEG